MRIIWLVLLMTIIKHNEYLEFKWLPDAWKQTFLLDRNSFAFKALFDISTNEDILPCFFIQLEAVMGILKTSVTAGKHFWGNAQDVVFLTKTILLLHLYCSISKSSSKYRSIQIYSGNNNPIDMFSSGWHLSGDSPRFCSHLIWGRPILAPESWLRSPSPQHHSCSHSD